MYKIKYFCEDNCNDPQNIQYINLEDLLSQIQEGGWPICAECGRDLDYEILESIGAK